MKNVEKPNNQFRRSSPKAFYLLLGLLCICCGLVGEVGIKFQRLSINDGLSSNSVISILQDRQGFMWFGTQDGLNRYDGYEFKTYYHRHDDPHSVGDDVQMTLLEDSRGRIWVGGFQSGLSRLDPETDCFIHFPSDPDDPSGLSHYPVQALFEDSSDRLWIGTSGGGLYLLIASVEAAGFFRFQHDPLTPNSLVHDNIQTIHEDQTGAIWVGTENGINRLIIEEVDQTGGENKGLPFKVTFTHYRHDPQVPGSISNNDVWAIYKDASGVLWVGTRKGLNRYYPEDNTFTNYLHIPGNPGSLSHNHITAISEDESGVLWIGTFAGGLNTLPPNPEREKGKPLTFTHYQANLNNPYSLSSNEIWSIYRDRSGVMWIGTIGGGISLFNQNRNKFRHYPSVPNDTTTLSNPGVWAIHEDRSGILWIGTSGGLNRLNRETGHIDYYCTSPVDSHCLSNNMVRTIHEDRKGILWVGTYGGGVDRVTRHPKTPGQKPELTFVNYQPRQGGETTLKGKLVISFYEDRSGTFWIGTHGSGLFRLNPETDTLTQYKTDPKRSGSLSSDYVWCIFQDHTGTMWFGTYGGGLSRLNRDKISFTHFRHVPDAPNSISCNNVFCIYESPNAPGILWLGTYGSGVNKFDVRSGTCMQYRNPDSSFSGKVYGILEAADPSPERTNHSSERQMFDLWLTTSRGLWQLNPETGTFRKFSTEDGLQSIEFNAGAFYKNQNGELFFGGVNGMNSIFPSAMAVNTFIPPVVLTDFKLFQRSVALNARGIPTKAGSKQPSVPLSCLEEIRLKNNENFFSFRFAALDFTAPKKNRYAYMLEGIDENWIYCDADNRVANYTAVEPGYYIFRVKGSNSDGTWNNTPTTIGIIVTPPFWKTWWFHSIILAAVGGLMLFLVHKWISRVKKGVQQAQQKLKQEMEKKQLEKELMLKADFTAMVVHDLRSPLSAVMGYSEMLEAHYKEMDVPKVAGIISTSSKRMLNLINDMLDISKFEAGKMVINTAEYSLENLALEVKDLMQTLLNRKSIKIVCDFPGLPTLQMDGQRISQVITNFISNALKFSPTGGKITLQTSCISLEDRTFQEFTVTDEGPGIPKKRRPVLFEKYAQFHSDSQTRVIGTGLGLAASRYIIELHGGEIGYRPGEKGGSVFFFRLPQ